MIRIFVGVAANHEDAESQAVLEYTLKKHASEPLQIEWMKLSRDPESPYYCNPAKREGWHTEQWATPFTGFRWIVPGLCDFKGRAIYMDSDVIVQADIADLWRQEFMPNTIVIAKADTPWRFCVSLWDCAAAERYAIPPAALMADPSGHRQMTRKYAQNPSAVQRFDGNWNCLDGEHYADLADPDIKAIHYSSMRHQPHLKYATKRLALTGAEHWFGSEPADHWRPDLQALFDVEIEAARRAGFPAVRYTLDPIFGKYKKLNVSKQGQTIPGWGKRTAT